MGINGIGADYPAWRETGKVQKNGSGIGFASRMADMVGTNASESGRKANVVSGRDNYVGGNTTNIYGMGVYSRKDISVSQESNLPIETERYKIADASYVEGVPAYDIVDKLTGKGLYMREDQMAIQKDGKMGMEFLINMDQPLSSNVMMTGELKNILNDLLEKRNIDIKEIPLQGGLVVNHDSKTGLNYLTFSGNEAKGVSVILTSEEDIETLNKLVDEFQKYEVSSQRSTAGLYALLEISGNLKREGEGFTYLTPNGITYIPYDGNPDKAWEIEIPSSDYSAARKYLAMGIEASNYQTWLSKFNNAKLLDTGTELLTHFSNERILSDEEVEQVGSQESKTKTEIIVRPDGSRVLVMTRNIGGMEIVMSLEISKPTEAPAPEGTRQNANVQDIYEALKNRVSNEYVKEQGSLENATETDAGTDNKKLTVWYKGRTLDEWALTSPKYTDSATGISWYIIDGKQPYMTGEDAEKFKKMCKETGEFPLKKFAEMTGTIQYLDDNTTAYIGDNGTAIKSKDGKELWIDTSFLPDSKTLAYIKTMLGVGYKFGMESNGG